MIAITTLLPVAWFLLILGGAWLVRPRPIAARRLGLVGAGRPHSTWLKPVAWVGAVVVVDVRLGAAVGIGLWIRAVMAKRRAKIDRERAIARELPEVIDLLVLSLAAGGSLSVAVASLSGHGLGPVSEAMAKAAIRIGRGHRVADAVETAFVPLGEPAAPLRRALVGADHYGTEVGPTLHRLADEAREARRRRAQADARRVPVRMLMPLVVAVLPAFVLLTVVPTLAGTFDGLDLSPP